MGSASQPMLVVRANRALLKKRKSFKEIREAYENYAGEGKLHFRELTPFEQKKIRDKIITQARKDRIQEIKQYGYAFVLLCLIVLAIYFLFFESK
ncbi:MAG: hypothetical protein AAFQ20_08330 [Bacteroidota bacterium]